MTMQTEHDFLITGSHDEANRQAYAATLRMHVLTDIGNGLKDVYDQRVAPAFEKSNGRAPKDGREAMKAMLDDTYGKTWSSMIHTCQEMLWDSVRPAVERAQPDFNEKVRGLNSKVGSVSLDPSVEVPRYVSASDIHLMPGNYHTERAEDDTSQGALFDRGLYLYQGGFAGPLCDNNGRSQAEVIKRRWPEFKPKKILDLGCTVGNNTLPYADVFPDAELHAIDVAAPCVRYGHARAEALGVPCHFHQMNAEATSFEDESFDLIVSCILFHETSRTGLEKILAESHRLLKPGGMMLHMEVPRTEGMDPYSAFRLDWDTYYNNEPFLSTWMRTDVGESCVKAGFDADNYIHIAAPDLGSVSDEEFTRYAKAEDSATGTHGHWGELVMWNMYGAWK
ncbi:MAG: methyltransferase domain-containing protein [Alphaproteobacteria bacterium]|nr:methyltransferase domain-containing protein [Alphaproteobacteria bacterium]